MDTSESIYKGLKDAGIDFIVSVPCANLSKLLNKIDNDENIKHVPVNREEEGIGICAGAYLGGAKTAILMQNSGLGNSINALKSLTELYEFPLIMIISHRGTEGESICGQIPMGKSTTKLLDGMEYPYFKINNKNDTYNLVKKSWNLSCKKKKPISILIEINYW
ncbi:sulfopyruvate decarboxylase subunit alpha [Methanobrevibacter olleyae]|uniref:sulfopyruvate decarboxylase n=1 Tax=Methanobrevibacter olleyae TaxID=294671 RepID=A0A126R042_METOL|nr:sulfopyruvate decarboxylase subunit alpha [Methanobrevibacter olleyae]AMK15438.1 sulfopyruvate decarboxylase alpha subunit ComD [Methanobrevibacter olleyae]